MKFQNICIHGSKVMLCKRKHDERTDKPEAICPPTLKSSHDKIAYANSADPDQTLLQSDQGLHCSHYH